MLLVLVAVANLSGAVIYKVDLSPDDHSSFDFAAARERERENMLYWNDGIHPISFRDLIESSHPNIVSLVTENPLSKNSTNTISCSLDFLYFISMRVMDQLLERSLAEDYCY